MAENDPGFAGSRSLIQQQQAALPAQFEADQKGLEAQAARANEGIINSARRRGTGIAFGGIPIDEQMKYNATEFMPAVAKLKQGQISQQMSLQDALNQLDREQRGQAQGIYQTELDREQQERQFQQQLAAQQRAAAASVARPTLAVPKAPQPIAPTNPVQQLAFNDAYTRLSSQSDDELLSDIRATRISAGKGNEKDMAKLQVYNQYRPDLFKNPASDPNWGNNNPYGDFLGRTRPR